jgi:type IV pilus assembly protein PilN
MIRINLLPVRAVQKKERLVNQLAILILAVIATVLVCFFSWMSFSGRIDDVKTEISTKQNKINSLKKTLNEIKGFETSKKDLQAKLDILDKLKSDRSGPVKLLDALSRSIPEEVWIMTFSEDNGVVSMTGGGMTEQSIATFMKNLEKSPYYMDIELGSIEQKKTGDNEHLSFNISCTVQKSELPDSKQ